MEQFYIGRQPIYDRNLAVYAYELLFRSGPGPAAGAFDGDQATSQVMINAFMDLGLEALVGARPAFINLTRNFITGQCPVPFSHEKVVLELLEDIEPDAEVIAAVDDLLARGYTVALDDFGWREALRPLVERVQIVKVEVMNLSADEVTREAKLLRQANPKLRLLAEKVEDQAMFDHCKAAGFDYFQGFFFSRPNVVSGRSLPGNRMVMLNLLAKMQNPEVEFDELEKLISQDVSLTYRLLRYVNSAAAGLRTTVGSVGRAIGLIGTQTIRKWVSLILLARIEDKPRELMVTALVRARMCELLARGRDAPDPEHYFTAGLFSVLPAMLDQPMDALLEQVPLEESIKQALTQHQGPIGGVLRGVLSYEAGAWDALDAQQSDPQSYRQAYLEAVQWADENTKALAE